MPVLHRLILEEDGQSLVEYGLILGLVSVGLVAVLGTMKTELFNIFTEIGTQLQIAVRKIK
ncbi:MAG: Flp family type IVb pilin [Candidatus Sericytochromatia bacterium]